MDCKNEHLICHKCGGVMILRTANEEFSVNGEVVKIDDVKEYFCENCGETAFKGSEVQKIQSAIEQKHQEI